MQIYLPGIHTPDLCRDYVLNRPGIGWETARSFLTGGPPTGSYPETGLSEASKSASKMPTIVNSLLMASQNDPTLLINLAGRSLERPPQGVAYGEFVSFRVEGRAAIEIVQERKIDMKIVSQLETKGCLGGCTETGGIG